MVVRFYSSVAPETTLSAGITNVATVITVGSVTGFPVNFPYTLALDYEGATEELVQVSNAAGTTLTVARAVDGTSAASHNAGARVRHVSSARDFRDSRDHENADDGIHGLALGDVLVGETKVQTLSNKTLTSPGINGGNLNNTSWTGTFSGGALDTFRSVNVQNVSPTSTAHAFQIGTTAGANLRMDNNEIQAVTNGVGSSLGLQGGGGNVLAFNNVGAESLTNALNVNGQVLANLYNSTRTSPTATTYGSRITGDTNLRNFTRADGAIRWSDGTATSDVGISRTGVNTITVDNNLAVGATLTATTASIIDLTATGTFNAPITTASGATVGTVGAGWSLVALQGFMRGGTTFITGIVNRTGATITPNTASPDAGNITDTTMVTITAPWRSNAGYNVTVACPCTDGVGVGGARLNTDGTLDLVSWTPNNLIVSGGGANIRFSISFPTA